MNVLEIKGTQATAYLRYLLANDIQKLATTGDSIKALYSCMLNENGGVIDDLIVYKLGDNHYWTVFNAATHKKVMPWITQHATTFDVTITPLTHLAMLAIQGPQARRLLQSAINSDKAALLDTLQIFEGAQIEGWLIARTGYTGEDGVEIILPADEAPSVWRACLKTHIKPCGLGARDTLRLEAGMHLYGNDMDEQVSPLECGLAWTVAWNPEDRIFIGRNALSVQRKKGIMTKLAGIVLEARGVLRQGQPLIFGELGKGIITSGSFSPTLNCSIGIARIPKINEQNITNLQPYVIIRGKQLPVRVVKLPFVRHGQKVFV